MKSRQQAGFTLVEIAIVLVIVGLLLGAVLKGQELIFNTKVKATFNLSRELSAAMNAYQDRYKAIPGDDNQATVRFPTAVPAPVNGNSDGWIAWGSQCDNTTTGENCQSLNHLRLGGFISGQGPAAVKTPFGGLAAPAAWGQYHPNAGSAPALGFNPASVTHKVMSAMDTAFDDTAPTTGTIRCRNLAAYDMSNIDNTVPDWCSISM